MRTVLIACSLVLVSIPTTSLAGADEPDLVSAMGLLQRFSHKLDLAIRHENSALTGFYLHELEETVEVTASMGDYHGLPIGRLTEAMLQPALEAFEATLDADPENREAIDRDFDALVEACNACHAATGYGYLRIRRSDANPFMQDFSVGESPEPE